MASIGVVTMVRDEADRFLPAILKAWSSFADGIIAANDNSTDGTRELLEFYDATILDLPKKDPAAWGSESGPRKALFDFAVQQPFDWLLWLDADMVPLKSPAEFLLPHLDFLSFRLFDLWDKEGYYREDRFWQGHNFPRVWAIRNPGSDGAKAASWTDRGIHCGHIPSGLPLYRGVVVPPDYSLLHYAYSGPQLREAKHKQYMAVANQLQPNELAHAESIVDRYPRLVKLPYPITWAI